MATTGGMEIEHVKLLGQVSTIMRSLTSKDGESLSHFDKFNDGDTHASITNTSLKEMLTENHTVVANKGKIKGHLPLEHIFGFCKTFEEITENLGFNLILKTNDLQIIVFTTIATDINETTNSLYLFVPIIIPNTETQIMFNESIKNSYTITYDSWYTVRKLSIDGNELQVDIGSAQQVIGPEKLIASFQTADRIAAPNRNNTVLIFDEVTFRKYFCEIDGYRYPTDADLRNFPENDNLDQYKDLKFFEKNLLEKN